MKYIELTYYDNTNILVNKASIQLVVVLNENSSLKEEHKSLSSSLLLMNGSTVYVNETYDEIKNKLNEE